MAKLLRVKQPPFAAAGNTQLAAWDAQLFDGIQLRPHARIGLRSLTVPFQRIVTVEAPTVAGDNTITLQLSAGGVSIQAVVPAGAYTPEDFLALLANLICAQLSLAVAGARGLRCVFTETLAGPLAFSFQAATAERTTVAAGLPQNNITAGAGNPVILSPTVAPAGDDTWLVDTANFWGKTCGYLSARYDGGVVALGLITDFALPDPANPVLPLAAFAYYVRAVAAGNYFIWSVAGAIEVDTGIAAQAADVMRIEVTLGRVQYNVYRGNNPLAGFPIIQDVLDLSLDYNPAVSLRNAAARITAPVYLADQGTGLNADPPPDEGPGGVDGLGVIPVIAGNGVRRRTLSMGEAIRSLLGGFPARNVFRQSSSGTLVAPEPPDYSGEISGVIVEVPTFGTLAAWDGATNRRRPILAAIPWARSDSRAVLSYETPSPLMLELGNVAPLIFRNLSIRILVSLPAGDQLATLADPASAVIVFEDAPP